jgi:hypothetical protein
VWVPLGVRRVQREEAVAAAAAEGWTHARGVRSDGGAVGLRRVEDKMAHIPRKYCLF